jgi:two-component system phosphate regulon response regulator PhoB
MVKKDMPDLIITDLAMPKMTGNIVIRILKKNDAFKHIPIIMLSAFIRGTEKNSVEVPADEYITKPFSAEALIGKVQELLAKTKKN